MKGQAVLVSIQQAMESRSAIVGCLPHEYDACLMSMTALSGKQVQSSLS